MVVAELYVFLRSASKLAEMYRADCATKTGEIDRAKAAPETVDTKAPNKAGEVNMKISSEPKPGTPIKAVRGFPWRYGWRTTGCVGIVGAIILAQVLPYDGFPTFMDHSGKYPLVAHNKKQAHILNESGKAHKAGDE